MEGLFIHHVFFSLKNPNSIEDSKMLKEGLQLLSTCPQIHSFHIGKPAGTDREVIIKDYSFSWLATFANGQDEAAYQSEPIHHLFIQKYSHLWSSVRVFDSIDV
jgi:hypothetical protein